MYPAYAFQQKKGSVASLLKALLAGGLVVGLAGLQVVAGPTLVANHACVPTNGTASLFTLPFNLTNSLIQVAPSVRCGLFRASDTVTITTSNNAPLRIVSLCGDELYNGVPGDFQFPVGHYFAETTGDRTQFAVLPDDYQGTPFLGTEAKNGSFDPIGPRLVQIQPSWARAGVGWDVVEPQRGVWNWKDPDAFVAANQGRKVIYCTFMRPSWVGNSEFIARFAEYVKAVATRYNGQLYAIEIWNEPGASTNYSFALPASGWTNTTRFYGQLLQSSQQAIRTVSSSIKVIGPAWYGTGFDSETGTLAQLGAAQWLDALSFHDYTMKAIPPDTTEQVYLDDVHIISGIDVQVAKYQAALPGKPILVDEIGLYGHSALGIDWDAGVDELYLSDLDWELGMRRAIKYAVMYRAAGAEALIPHVVHRNATYPEANLEIYGWDLGPSVGTSRGPHPKTSAFLMSCYWLNGATFLGESTVGSNVLLYAWGYPDGSSITFAWCREGYLTSFQQDPVLQVTDVFNQPVSDTAFADKPILFHLPASIPSESVLGTVAATVQLPQACYPDLVVPVISGPATATAGDTIQVVESVQNLGSDAGPFSIGIYLWLQSTDYILIGTRAVDGLAGGGSSSATDSITLPANLVSGIYYFFSRADYLNSVQEINEDNNYRYSVWPIVITGGATPTLARIGAQTVMAGQNLAFKLYATATNGNPLTYSATSLPPGATLAAGGTFSWTPTSSQVGNYAVNFSVSNGHANDSEQVPIAVTKPYPKLTLKPIKPKRVRVGRRLCISLSAKNPKHQPLTYSIDPLPVGATFNLLKRKFVWTTTNATIGVYSLTASVTDGTGSDTKPVTITVY